MSDATGLTPRCAKCGLTFLGDKYWVNGKYYHFNCMPEGD